MHLPDDGSPDGLDEIFPASGGINTLTDRETEALTELGLWHDWTTPPPSGKEVGGQQDQFTGCGGSIRCGTCGLRDVGPTADGQGTTGATPWSPPVPQPAREIPTVKEKVLAPPGLALRPHRGETQTHPDARDGAGTGAGAGPGAGPGDGRPADLPEVRAAVLHLPLQDPRLLPGAILIYKANGPASFA
ncbi:hypothetical protein ACWGA9_35045 [Streptomyces sp. NPDC054950]